MDTCARRPAAGGAATAEASDGTLLRNYRSGDDDAATQLYYRYATRLRSVAAARRPADLAPRVDADDVVQSVFRVFFEKARRGAYDVAGGRDLWNLLLVLALNKVRAEGDFHRAAKRDSRLTVSPAGHDLPAETPGPGTNTLAFLELVIEEALAKLPPSGQAIVRMRIAGYEIAEIAESSRRSKRTVERVMQEFRALLDEREPVPPPRTDERTQP